MTTLQHRVYLDRLYARTRVLAVKTEGHLLYGGMPRPGVSDGEILVGGTEAGLVDATNGEGIFEAAMSGRFAADAAVRAIKRSERASVRYASLIADRFRRRLQHRVALMRFLEQRPRRFALLFEQLARTPGLGEVLQKEDCERTMSERLFLYLQALRFGARGFTSRE
jgi:flavin-dependent dehydrogenase